MEEAGGDPAAPAKPALSLVEGCALPCHTCRRIGAITVEDKAASAREGRMAQGGLLGTVNQGTTSLPEALLKGGETASRPSPLEGEGGGEGGTCLSLTSPQSRSF